MQRVKTYFIGWHPWMRFLCFEHLVVFVLFDFALLFSASDWAPPYALASFVQFILYPVFPMMGFVLSFILARRAKPRLRWVYRALSLLFLIPFIRHLFLLCAVSPLLPLAQAMFYFIYLPVQICALCVFVPNPITLISLLVYATSSRRKRP